MFEALIMMGISAGLAYVIRRSLGTPMAKGPAVVLLGVVWLTGLASLGSAGGTGGPGWLHAGVIIAFFILTRSELKGSQEGGKGIALEEEPPKALHAQHEADRKKPEETADIENPDCGEDPVPIGRLWYVAGLAGVFVLGVMLLGSPDHPPVSGADTQAAPLSAGDIWEAAASGDARSVLAFVDDGIDPDARDPDGNTPLIVAAAAGQDGVVRTLLQAGADPNERGLFQTVALAEAAARGYRTMVQDLLEHGATPNAQGSLGWTPLHFAVYAADEFAVELLLRAGGDVQLDDVYGISPMDIAVLEENERIIHLINEWSRN